jgi:hypothetical protein
LNYFTNWYNTDKTPIPWSNTNAYFGDASSSCDGSTAVPISSISTQPHYQLNSITYSTISTYGVGQATAINNIKSALDSNKAVEYMFFYGDSGWVDFFSFWGSKRETSIFDPTPHNGESETAGHAVIIVGYDDSTDPSNPYWLVLNSWGAPTNRPNGLFRVNMSMNYSAVYYYNGFGPYQQNTFQILDSGFTGNTAILTVTGVSPGSGPATGGTPVTITGTNFTGANTVKFGGTANATGAMTVNSDTQITVTSPAHAAGPVDVTVTNITSGTSPTSANDKFTYIGIPVVTGISPGSGPAAGGTSVTITGTNLTGASTVTFGATGGSITANTATSITATSPAHAAGQIHVTVTTAGGTSSTSSSDQFTYVAAPTITGLSPTTGTIAGGTSVTISGSGFSGVSEVDFGTYPASIMTVSDTQITVHSSGQVAAGTVDVRVKGPFGTSAIVSADQFTYT